MRRLPGILLATAAIIIIIVALIVSGLRFFLPHIDEYRQQLVEKIADVTNTPVNMGYINGRWESFGPSLELHDISAKAENVEIHAKKIRLSLDIWRSLLQRRWYFRDLSFYQLQINYDKTLFGQQAENRLSKPDRLSTLFLEQFNHFDLYDSRLTFLAPSGEKVDLLLPQFTWLNKDNRHRAQGSVNLSSINGQEGIVQVKFDLKDINGVLDNGTVYLQADEMDMRPWLSRWLRDNTGLDKAHFSLASWVTLKEGRIDSGHVQLKHGGVNWHVGNEKHQLAVNDFLLQMRRQGEGWLFAIPDLASLKTNGQPWPGGKLSTLYLKQASKYQGQDHWRIRADNIQLEYLNGILPMLSFVTSDVVKDWQRRQPKGVIDRFALDITPAFPDEMGIRLNWRDVSWLHWKELPAINHFSGMLAGNVQGGTLQFGLKNSVIDDGARFQAPLEIASSEGKIVWKKEHDGLAISGQGLDLQAKSLWLNGNFRYLKPHDKPPVLAMLAGIRVNDIGESWRYFPKSLMGEALTDYLTAALIKGSVDNASFIFHGDPHDFPFKQNEGQFQVLVPLRHATFQYQPDWPALFDLDIDLNFQNNGLWMQAQNAHLGKVAARQVSAVIADYDKHKLFIDAELSGEGKHFHEYFNQSPMVNSIGNALNSLQLDGRVGGHLHLDIPLKQGNVAARGDVVLKDTHLFIKPLKSKMEHLNGKFRFDNGNLKSEALSANWLGHPLSLQFSTQALPKHYQVNVKLDSRWAAKTLPMLPVEMSNHLSGTLNWRGDVNITLPSGDSAANHDVKYRVAVKADLSHLKSKLPGLSTTSLREWDKLNLYAEGDMNQLQIKGGVGTQYAFNTQWALDEAHTRLQRGIFHTNSHFPELPKKSLLTLKLPAIEGDKLLALLELLRWAPSENQVFSWPGIVDISLPALDLAGQRWHQLTFNVARQHGSITVSAQGQEINGNLLIQENKPMQAVIHYLYYDPRLAAAPSRDSNHLSSDKASVPHYSLNKWPALDVQCTECWVAGLKLGKVSGSIMPEGDALVLTHGQLENRAGKLALAGRWYENDIGNNSHITGTLAGNQFDDMAAYLGFIVPIVDAPFKFDFDLKWQNVPWQLDLKTLNGTLSGKMERGAIAKLGGGSAGQLLRFISFDALLRKLQLDFSDTFSNDFNFDSISGNATIKNGVMYTNNFLIDGLAADINATGQTDLVHRKLNMDVVITPDISATVSVATAFAVNPVVGAAVFAATKVLSPLWSKISLIRYRLTGSLEQPKIDEVLRQLKGDKEP
ncbi:conserved protein of unknown function [Xenorhabdus poinarii G6]|uniref:YhdP central domain-containing protein n=1 Tax=Xenorhabdus poinarii G6 TaxID=1354304 RepID=A0A068R9U3_9GAMM|nr:AsmA2 domain-containing protein YhdP [Xenorhabdus poinarii]CDG22965.1 conserved protein of unknown function [Xenorhabdus poinarii G6]